MQATGNLCNENIENLKVKYGAVIVDVIFDRGLIAQTFNASCAIPGVFVVVEIGGSIFYNE